MRCELAVGLHRVHAAVVELDALPDPVRPRAEDDHAPRISGRRSLVALVPGRVEVVRVRLDLAGDRVDPTVDRSRGLLARVFGLELLELALEPRMHSLGLPLELAFEA